VTLDAFQGECLLSFDVETSGPIPGKYSMVSIGACAVEDQNKSFYREVVPLTPEFVPEAMQTIGRNMRYFQDVGMEPADVMGELDRWVHSTSGSRRPVFVAFNAPFDWSFVNWYFYHFLGRNPLGISALDIKALYCGKFGTSWDETRSSKVHQRLHRSEHHTHNALDDAKEQAQLLVSILEADVH